MVGVAGMVGVVGIEGVAGMVVIAGNDEWMCCSTVLIKSS